MVEVAELRELILAAAPDPAQAAPVRDCPADAPLDGVIPFSSVIVLGTVIALEDRYAIRITQRDLARAFETNGNGAARGITLEKLAAMVETLLERGENAS